jgi:hypothetical protein
MEFPSCPLGILKSTFDREFAGRLCARRPAWFTSETLLLLGVGGLLHAFLEFLDVLG